MLMFLKSSHEISNVFIFTKGKDRGHFLFPNTQLLAPINFWLEFDIADIYFLYLDLLIPPNIKTLITPFELFINTLRFTKFWFSGQFCFPPLLDRLKHLYSIYEPIKNIIKQLPGNFGEFRHLENVSILRNHYMQLAVKLVIAFNHVIGGSRLPCALESDCGGHVTMLRVQGSWVTWLATRL